jgi:cytochrome c oxidase subunit 2
VTRSRYLVVVLGGLVAGLVVSGCSGHAPSILHAQGSESKSITGIWWLMFTLGAVVYAVVAGFIIWAMLRGRRDGRVSDTVWIVWGGIGVPVVILGVLAVTTVKVTGELRKPAASPIRLEVVAKRWWWDISYVDAHFKTANEIHLPAGQPVEIGLDSDNVIHSFWVPELAGKLDAVPGQHNVLRFTPNKPGVLRGECAEFCGVEHARMGFEIVVQTPADYARWVARQQPTPLPPDSEASAEGQQVFMRESCAGCHTIRGTQAQGAVGPDLTDFGSRLTIGGDTVGNTPDNLAAWISDAQRFKPGALMPPIQLSGADLGNVVSYLEGLK